MFRSVIFSHRFKGGVLGAISGGFAEGIGYTGALMNGAGYSAAAQLATRAVLHGALNAFTSAAIGGKWSAGFYSGSVGTFLEAKLNIGSGYHANVAKNAIISGTVSSLTGGKFANGAIMGAFRYMFNDAAHKTHEEIMEMQYKHWKGGYKAYLDEQKRLAYDKMLRERFPHATNLMQSHEQSEYYQSRLKSHEFAKPIVTGPSTGDVVGFGLSVAAAFGTGGWSYFLGASAIAIDVFQGDPYETMVGVAALTTWKPATVGDIAYGGCRLSSECSETLDTYLP